MSRAALIEPSLNTIEARTALATAPLFLTSGLGVIINEQSKCPRSSISRRLKAPRTPLPPQILRRGRQYGVSRDDDPDVDMANTFIEAHGYKAELCPGMTPNPLAV